MNENEVDVVWSGGRYFEFTEQLLTATTGRLHVLGKGSDCLTEAGPEIYCAATVNLSVPSDFMQIQATK
jgi:hypothetical protein